MAELFTASFKEALQCTLLISILFFIPKIWEQRAFLLTGISLSFPGFFIGLSGYAGDALIFARHMTEIALLYMPAAYVYFNHSRQVNTGLIKPALIILGLLILFFEMASLGLVANETLSESGGLSYLILASGLAIGFSPLIFCGRLHAKAGIGERAHAPAVLLMAFSLNLLFGGVKEAGDVDAYMSFLDGAANLLNTASALVQQLLMVKSHPFLYSPMGGLFEFLSGDRAAMSLTVVVFAFPPLYLLAKIISRPDPEPDTQQSPAERRLGIAFFRRGLMWHAAPVLISLFAIIIVIHTANASLTPMFEPPFVPVRESEDAPGNIIIPLSGREFDFSDGKLRKFVYYYGNRQVLFISMLKPDGTLGVALDECEICKPAEWNKAAQGYAQRGGHLVCKYCVTPVAVESLNKPGGCNPIPVPFKTGDGTLIISLDDLISVYKSAKELQKKGTHL